jgi:hypothetical protein
MGSDPPEVRLPDLFAPVASTAWPPGPDARAAPAGDDSAARLDDGAAATTGPPVMAVMPAQKLFRSRQDYAMPRVFLTAVKARLGIATFAYDLAAHAENAVKPRYLDSAQDALAWAHWAPQCGGGWGWLIPPFARIAPWAAECRATSEAGHVAFLVPAALGANWFRDDVDGHGRVLFLNGRLCFMQEQPHAVYPKDCLLTGAPWFADRACHTFGCACCTHASTSSGKSARALLYLCGGSGHFRPRTESFFGLVSPSFQQTHNAGNLRRPRTIEYSLDRVPFKHLEH